MSRDQKKVRILRNLEQVPIKETAYNKANVSHATFYRWMKEDKEFARNVKQALIPGRARVTDVAESQLIKAIQVGEPWAIRYWLNNNTSRYNAYSSANMKGQDDDATEIRPIYVMGKIHDMAEKHRKEQEEKMNAD